MGRAGDALWALARSLVPAIIKSAMHGARYVWSGQPITAFRQAAHLENAGCPRSAAKIYNKLLESRSTDQQLCFQAGRQLWRLGVPSVHDPLFACGAIISQQASNVLAFEVAFTYPGLWLFLRLRQQHRKDSPALPDVVQIRLGHTVLRSHRLEWNDDGVASFQFIVKREVVSLFPISASLSVTSEGNGMGTITILASASIDVPHGGGTLVEQIALRGILEKKGSLRPVPEELASRQQAYLDLYQRASFIFENELGCKLTVLYGTLLGLHRDGDFIPGDDDFDVGYVSEADEPREVKREAGRFIRTLVRRGFKVSLNRAGRPFRLSDTDAPQGIHLDVRPVWSPGDNHVWMHKHARLSMSLDGFREVEAGVMRGVNVWKPAGTVSFLKLYYGENWKVPDPGFSNSGKHEVKKIAKILQECCFTTQEQAQLWTEIAGAESVTLESSARSRFAPIDLLPVYPLPASSVDRNSGLSRKM